MTSLIAFIDGLGGPEMMLILFIVLLLFGADKMPGFAKGLGKAIREFKKAASGVEEEVRRAMEEHEEAIPKKFPPKPPQRAPVVPPAPETKEIPPPASSG
jgi:sec-independent protein translocase protein TatA